MLFQSYKSSLIIKFLIGAMLLVYIFSLYHRYIQQDEPWFGEQAYWLVNEGNVKLKSMPGVFDWTNNMLIYHKLFIWFGALLITVFGWSIYIFKTAILALTIICVGLIFKFLKKEHGVDAAWLAILLLVTTPELIHRSFMFRPEIMIMLFGFCSFYFLERKVFKSNSVNVIMAGVFAGLAFLTHLNALVFPVTGFLFLLIYKRWKDLLVFSISAGIICAFYSTGLWDAQSLQTFKYQLQHWPTHQDTFGEKIDGGFIETLWNNLKRLLNEHKRYFWDQDVWGISAVFLISMISRFKYLKNQHGHLLAYTLILMVTLGVLSSSHGPRYLVYLMPFMVSVASLTIITLSKENLKRRMLTVFFVVVIFAQLVFSGLAFDKIFNLNKDYVEIHKTLVSSIKEGSNILGPWEMIYNEIDKYHIHSFKTYEYIEDQQRIKLSQPELLKLAAEKFNIDYIILDKQRKLGEEFDWFKGWKIEPNPYYNEYKTLEGYKILKRIR